MTPSELDKSEIEHHENMKRMAAEALDAAMTSADPEAIGHILEFFRFSETRPSDEKLIAAEKRRDELAAKVTLKHAALGALSTALASRELNAIDEALRGAVETGWPPDSAEIVEAERAKAAIAEEQARSEADAALTPDERSVQEYMRGLGLRTGT